MWHKLIGFLGRNDWEQGLENYYNLVRVAAILAMIAMGIIAYLFHPSLF